MQGYAKDKARTQQAGDMPSICRQYIITVVGLSKLDK